MNAKLRALLEYVAPRAPTSTHLRVIATMADFEAYRVLGDSITGTVWRKWHEFAFPDGMTEVQWERETRRIWRRAQPLHLVLAGDLVAAYALLKAVRS